MRERTTWGDQVLVNKARTLSNSAFLIKFFEILVLQYVNGTPLQYSCLENPMDGGAW